MAGEAPFLVPINLNGLELRNAVLHLLASAPGSPTDGQLYYNTGTDTVEFYNGTAFVTLGRLDQIEAPTGDVDLNSHKIINLASPSASGDAAPRGYVLGLTINALTALAADYSMNSHKLTNLTDGSGANDAVNKSQLDAVSAAISAVAAGISWKDSVRAASTVNVTLATGVENGDTVGGVVLATGNRVGLFGQTTPAENGIWVVPASGAPTRATDADSGTDLQGAFVPVDEGTHAAKIFYLATDAVTIDVTSQTWTEFTGATYTGGAGLVLTGVDFAVGAGTGIVVNANDVAVSTVDDNTRVVRKYGETLTASATSYNIDHNLNTKDVTVAVYDTANSPYSEVRVDVQRSTVNRVILIFAVAPTASQYRVVVHG